MLRAVPLQCTRWETETQWDYLICSRPKYAYCKVGSTSSFVQIFPVSISNLIHDHFPFFFFFFIHKMLWINHMLNLLWRYVSHVFTYLWTTAVASNSRQPWRLVVLAGELVVIAGASRSNSRFLISSLTLPSPVPEVFVPLFITVTSHWGQKGDIATNAAVRISWQLTDWWPHHSLPRWNKLPELQEKKYLTHTWEEVGGLLSF